MIKTVEMDFEFQPYLSGPPMTPKQLFRQAASNDEITIQSWEKIWLDNIKKNHDKYGPFNKSHIGQFFGKYKGRPAIIVGSGPSLKGNIQDLVEASQHIPVVSCLHNFHYLEDHGVSVDFYVTLDAGEVTIPELSEGGTRDEDLYWSLTKGKKLLAFIGTSPNLIAKWQGEIFWFHVPLPDQNLMAKIEEIEVFNACISTGGNVLGASLYSAKAIMGANPIVFVGADFSFSYTKKFHGWDSKYDASMGYAFKVPDVFGNKVYTWQSYYNFKMWFDYVTQVAPGIYLNASEGGCLGAYQDGNIQSIIQTSLSSVVKMYSHHEHLKEQFTQPGVKAADRQIKLLF